MSNCADYTCVCCMAQNCASLQRHLNVTGLHKQCFHVCMILDSLPCTLLWRIYNQTLLRSPNNYKDHDHQSLKHTRLGYETVHANICELSLDNVLCFRDGMESWIGLRSQPDKTSFGVKLPRPLAGGYWRTNLGKALYFQTSPSSSDCSLYNTTAVKQ